MTPEDVPQEAVTAFCQAFWGASTAETRPAMGELARTTLAAVLPAHERQVMAKLFGTPEEIAAREAEAAQRTPDDTVRLCEMARPGEHERRTRERVAEQILETIDADVPGPYEAGLERAAQIARGDS